MNKSPPHSPRLREQGTYTLVFRRKTTAGMTELGGRTYIWQTPCYDTGTPVRMDLATRLRCVRGFLDSRG